MPPSIELLTNAKTGQAYNREMLQMPDAPASPSCYTRHTPKVYLFKM